MEGTVFLRGGAGGMRCLICAGWSHQCPGCRAVAPEYPETQPPAVNGKSAHYRDLFHLRSISREKVNIHERHAKFLELRRREMLSDADAVSRAKRREAARLRWQRQRQRASATGSERDASDGVGAAADAA